MTGDDKHMLGGIEVIAPRCGLLGRGRLLVGFACVVAAIFLVVACRLAWANPSADNVVTNATVEASTEVAALQSASRDDTSQVVNSESELADSYALDVPALLQYPELPTGCESVALVDVLLFHGFEVGKTEVADSWLPTSSTDFVHAFLGNPRDANGHSCMAPALTSAANAYLDAHTSSLEAVDVTGSSFTEVLATVGSGTPVIVWCTINLADPGKPYQVAYENGFAYGLYTESHCVAVSGYDLAAGLVYVSDPIAGQVAYPLDIFATRYYQLGAQAIVIS